MHLASAHVCGNCLWKNPLLGGPERLPILKRTEVNLQIVLVERLEQFDENALVLLYRMNTSALAVPALS